MFSPYSKQKECSDHVLQLFYAFCWITRLIRCTLYMYQLLMSASALPKVHPSGGLSDMTSTVIFFTKIIAITPEHKRLAKF